MASSSSKEVPSSVLIVGSGVFGLSTAYALTQRPEFAHSKITVLDRSPFPAPDGSSVDTSRIVRADYADIAYAQLCLEAQALWRNSWWGDNAYHEDGLVIAIKNAADAKGAADGEDHSHGVANLTGREYMRRSLENVQRLGLKEAPGGDVEVLPDMSRVRDAFHQTGNDKRGDGKAGMTFDADMGYINRRSGWVDATAALTNLRRRCEATGRINFVTGQAKRLIYTRPSSPQHTRYTVSGVTLTDSTTLTADLTILATGAWTPSLLDLRGRASATGQIVGYIALSPAETSTLSQNPTILNESTGLFIITPSAEHLKVARHGYGYANPTTIPNPEPRPLYYYSSSSSADDKYEESITVSLPQTQWDDGPSHSIPTEGQSSLRAFLRTTFPSLAERPFTQTRLCWYTDTAVGDWIISHHPEYDGLFVATGGSGHGFKFAPVVGEAIVQRVLGEEVRYGLSEKWGWPERKMGVDGGHEGDGQVWTEDWRGGRKGMVLAEEYKKGKTRETKL
ncbi:FAD dependent oxidoreductase [Myriangium duriaei CBS 260.36]|uniref:FAD dependent oxidoreductase n=1 Tax=Myriangium duriaei CBS 260.36 TaxID=1168546 RepID=A0A9P4ML95_9PEZI|nr:FAD dependent oxidoreductase [Myriangium duriaei CBS 260.36]